MALGSFRVPRACQDRVQRGPLWTCTIPEVAFEHLAEFFASRYAPLVPAGPRSYRLPPPPKAATATPGPLPPMLQLDAVPGGWRLLAMPGGSPVGDTRSAPAR